MGTASRLGLVAALAGAVLALAGGTPAFAHQEVTLGAVDFEIGFADEPVYVGFPNAVFLSIHGEGGKPITDAADTLKVRVVYGQEAMDVALEPNFDPEGGGEPGQYLARFIPSRPGAYTFHLSGMIEGEQIDRDFTSSPTTFDEAVDPTAIEFPVKDPTLGQLAERLDREIPRVTARAQAEVAAAQDQADSARTLALIGVVLGGVGLVVGVIGLVVAKRRRT